MQLSSDLVTLSQDFLHVARYNKYAKSFKYHLANLPIKHLSESLTTEERKFIFWVNIYNAFVQVLLKEQPNLYREPQAFHHIKLIVIAGHKLSLWQIESGIIRQTKKSRKAWFPSALEKECRLQNPNVLIHFALNQANKSSPPIASYEEGKSHEQLEAVARFFLKEQSSFSPNDNTLWLPRLTARHKADFGGRKGILELLKKYEIIAETPRIRLRYKKHDWTIALNNFFEQSVSDTIII